MAPDLPSILLSYLCLRYEDEETTSLLTQVGRIWGAPKGKLLLRGFSGGERRALHTRQH
ncbi:unnamed protein product [Fusarium graminearum]|uniref:Chromosome 4, complete genome n=1 Tax=Gibberella zeae (strain ATCC MYA-4620 / CBS 123657 / FGSC 9075 / NRRL 31084 / PH-1) TaxID=229533 RepID=A0A098DTZ9_GIBZE|nr:unnamed protein product [Fusarium graminearum]CZS74052.1 unnamed protein product [Fusarium graminearum]